MTTTPAPPFRHIDQFAREHPPISPADADDIASDAELQRLTRNAEFWREQVEGKNCRIEELEGERDDQAAQIRALQHDLAKALDQLGTARQERDTFKATNQRGW